MARQFNLNGFNGLHLKAPYDYTTYSSNGLSALIENFDFYPLKSTDLNYFKFVNSSDVMVDKTSIYYGKIMGDSFIGSNSYANRTHDFTYSQIEKTNELVKGEIYKSKFNFYFNFDGDVYGYDLGSSGYTISVSLYMVLGTTKRKLNLSNLQIYQYKSSTYSGTTSNPVEAGYANISSLPSGYFPYDDYVNITGDNINVSFVPQPRTFDIVTDISNSSNITYSYTEGDHTDINYGHGIGGLLGSGQALRVISFARPVVTAGPGNTYTIIDNGPTNNEISPFNVMSNGPLFRVTAELDDSTQQEFEANICKGNKDIKIIVDYNGKLAKKTIEYVYDMDSSASSPPLPSF